MFDIRVLPEKGKYQTATQKALARLEYEPVNALWKKPVNGKYIGESIFADACSDYVSEQIAPVSACLTDSKV